MLNPSAYALGANRSCIRDLFEYGCQRAAVVGRENVYDYSLGNPSIPSPKEVDETTELYRKCLAAIDRRLAAVCDVVAEVAAGNPKLYKGALPL